MSLSCNWKWINLAKPISISAALLYIFSGVVVFKAYVLKWIAYIDDWSQLPFLHNEKYTKYSYVYADGFTDMIGRLISNRQQVVKNAGRK